MLSKNKWFRVTTFPDNEEMLSDALNKFDVVIESERYYSPDSFEFKPGATRFTLECHVDIGVFDELVEYLEVVFADSFATIEY